MARKGNKEFKVTRGSSELVGKIYGLNKLKKELIDKDGNVIISKSKKSDFEFKRLSFGIQTSENNNIRVGLMGGKYDSVNVFPTDKNSGLEKKKVPFNKRKDIPKGYNCIETRLKSNNDNNAINHFKWDAVDYILNNFEDGDSVYFNSSTEWQKYKDTVLPSNELNKMLVRREDIDFDGEDFQEFNKFSQNIIVKSFTHDKEDEEGTLECYIIQNKEGKYVVAELPVQITKTNSAFIRKLKKIPEGSALTVHGRVYNTVTERQEILEENAEWGVTLEISKSESKTITDYVSKVLVIYADASSYEENAVDIEELEEASDKDDLDDNYNDRKSSSKSKSSKNDVSTNIKDKDVDLEIDDDYDF